jgi:hypothetical protein
LPTQQKAVKPRKSQRQDLSVFTPPVSNIEGQLADANFGEESNDIELLKEMQGKSIISFGTSK